MQDMCEEPEATQATPSSTPNTAEDTSSFVARMRAKRLSLEPSRPNLQDELENYVSDTTKIPDDDGLTWWGRFDEVKYPHLAVIARRHLSISASSISSERLFSSGRGIVNYKRNRLAADTNSMLMTLENWIKEVKYDPSIDTQQIIHV